MATLKPGSPPRRAKLLPPYSFGPSPESLETALVSPSELPFDEASRPALLLPCLARDASLLPPPACLATADDALGAGAALQLAFSSVSLALRLYLEDLEAGGSFRVHHGVIEKQEGSSPNDPASYRLRDHMALTLAPPGRPASRL